MYLYLNHEEVAFNLQELYWLASQIIPLLVILEAHLYSGEAWNVYDHYLLLPVCQTFATIWHRGIVTNGIYLWQVNNAGPIASIALVSTISQQYSGATRTPQSPPGRELRTLTLDPTAKRCLGNETTHSVLLISEVVNPSMPA